MKKKNRLLSFALDLFFPSFCVGCGTEGSFLCPKCEGKIVIRRVPSSTTPRGIRTVYAACEYSQPLVSELIQQLKYRGIKDASEQCAGLILSHLARADVVLPDDAVVVPVPLSSKRLRERGFNQSGLIAGRVAQALSLPFSSGALERTRHTAPQTETNGRAMRIKNVKGAFMSNNGEVVKNKNIILVDDV
ncbi:ComF family protein, partial [Candidatus Azambacteria bacterium]|nr:ComF family protein [Candidatus Azambacteria bacterium]